MYDNMVSKDRLSIFYTLTSRTGNQLMSRASYGVKSFLGLQPKEQSYYEKIFGASKSKNPFSNFTS